MNSRNDTGFDSDVTFVDVPSERDGTDPLALFESESDPNGDRGAFESKEASQATSLTRVGRPMGLDQVLHRLGSVTWAEAVAIVEGLCGVLIEGERERVPELSGIAITASGGVAVAIGGTQEPTGPRLARILHALAATGSIPAPLRLFVTKWASASEEHSIAEFAKALGYFSRPDGQILIQGVYKRAVAIVPVRPTLRQEAPRPVPPTRQPRARDSRLLYTAAAAIVVLGVALTVHFAWRGTGSSGGSSSASSSTTTVPPAEIESEASPEPSLEAGALENGPDGQPAAPIGIVAASMPAPVPAGQPTRTTPVVPVRPRVNVSEATAPAPVSSAVRATLTAPPTASPRSAPLLPAPRTAAPVRSALEPNPARATRRDTSGAPIYSRSDADVTPPAFLQPQLPTQFLSGLRPDMNTIELIVTERGLVERVRLLSTPKRMADMMLLSGAKNWEFEPAVKDGQSVRYRLELSWAATP